MNSLANSESPLKRTNEFFSPLQRTFALRRGFQPLPDSGFTHSDKETGFLAESTHHNEELSKKPGFWPFARQPSKKPGFWPNLRITTKNYRKNPVSGYPCVSLQRNPVSGHPCVSPKFAKIDPENIKI